MKHLTLAALFTLTACAPEAHYAPDDCGYLLDRCHTDHCIDRVLARCDNPDSARSNIGRALIVGGSAVSQPSQRVTCNTWGNVTTCQ